MKDIFDVAGASGAVYRFTRFRDGNPLSAMGGNFIYAAERDEERVIVFAGEAQNLLTGARVHWDRAVAEHGAKELYTRLNISERTRKLEQADILGAVSPPMNASIDGA
jgi:hypothetical protein